MAESMPGAPLCPGTGYRPEQERRARPYRTTRFPLIDIAPFFSGTDRERGRVAREVAEACERIGFLVITGHGVPEDLIAAMYRTLRDYFDQPLARKLESAPPSHDVFRGYFGIRDAALSYTMAMPTPPDIREVFAMSRIDPWPPGYAPEGVLAGMPGQPFFLVMMKS